MKILDAHDVLGELCKATKKWGMYFSIYMPDSTVIMDVFDAAPWLRDDHLQVVADGYGYVLFSSKEEMERVYWSTVGDDGPTQTNPYHGPVTVYALTCSPKGVFMNENT